MTYQNIGSSKVAVVLPAYNCVGTISRAIDSIINQTYQNWVLYVIEDCSTDLTFSYISDKYLDPRIKIFKNDINLGVSETRNKGINLSSEDYICFIDSDDEWLPSKLDKQLNKIDAGYNIIITDYDYINRNGARTLVSYCKDYMSSDDFLKKKYRVCFSSIMIHNRKKVMFKKIGHEDFMFINEVLADNGHLYIIREKLVNYYESVNSLSSNKIKTITWQFKLLLDIFPKRIDKVIIYFFYYILNAIRFQRKIKNDKNINFN